MKAVYLVEGVRTPQVKSGTDLKEISAPYLGHYLIRHLMNKYEIPNTDVDEVIMGNTGTPAKYPNVSRVIALEAGLHKKTSAYSVHRNCASGMQALGNAFDSIALGRSDVIFAGGVESMSQMPLLYGKEMTDFFINMMKAKNVQDKLKILSSFRLPFLNPIIAIEQGLTDPFCGQNMGQTAENLAREFNITREQQDEYANRSHAKAVKAMKEGKFKDEILPIIAGSKLDKLISEDIGPRENSSIESLAKLKPYFEKVTGTVTVGNSCPITDGGSCFLLCSEEAVKRYNMKPMARFVNYHFHGLEPERMGLGPAMASHGVLKRSEMSMDQMDLIEVNEAFAAQIMAVQNVCSSSEVSKRWDINETIGEIPDEKLNVNGGAIAFGHPVGSSGCRIVVTLAHELAKRKAKYGIASLCIGGGQGGAVVVENLIQ
ncbi:thiolase family protein [Bacteriovoracaceae bacterium]|nr:thiolase family protein [Bacteriovoracaceae bacterium]